MISNEDMRKGISGFFKTGDSLIVPHLISMAMFSRSFKPYNRSIIDNQSDVITVLNILNRDY